MATIPPGTPGVPGAPMGGEPMKKTTGKVAPKKETVRITLPPKPSAAPTIKLPTLPPGGPTGAPSAIPLPSKAPTIAARPAAAPAAAPRAAAAPAPQKRAPAPASSIGTFDKILAIAAMVAALFAVASTAWLQWGIPLGN